MKQETGTQFFTCISDGIQFVTFGQAGEAGQSSTN